MRRAKGAWDGFVNERVFPKFLYGTVGILYIL